VEYFNLENTKIKKFTNTFLQYYPSLKVLKLSQLDIGKFINSTDTDFFGSCPSLTDIYLDNCNITNVPPTLFSRLINLQHLDMSNNYLRTIDLDLQNCTKINTLRFVHSDIKVISQKFIIHLTQLASRKPTENNLVVDLTDNKLHCLCNSTHFISWVKRPTADSNIKFPGFDRYTCLYPNGSIVRVSEVIVSELEQQCSVIQTLVNGPDCPCDEELKRRIEQVWVSLDGFFCKNDDGYLESMKNRPLPNCFNPYSRASFIVPVVVGGILGITVLITVGLLIYHRNSRRVRQVRECLAMNPVHFVRTAIEYVMMHNRGEERAVFTCDMIVFAQDEDRSGVHTHFIAALRGIKTFITRDDFLPEAAEVDAMVESIRVCRWIVPELTANFLSDPVCMDFVSRVQFSRPHALIPIVWNNRLLSQICLLKICFVPEIHCIGLAMWQLLKRSTIFGRLCVKEPLHFDRVNCSRCIHHAAHNVSKTNLKRSL